MSIVFISEAVIFGKGSQTESFNKFGLMALHCVKYLGLLIDDDLSFENQVEKIKILFRIYSFTHKALPEKISITCILQNSLTNCAVWRFSVRLHSF